VRGEAVTLRRMRQSGVHPVPGLSVGIVLTENFSLSAFAMITELMRLASEDPARGKASGVTWRVVGARSHGVRSSCGVKIEPTSRQLDPRGLDYLLVIGGLLDGGHRADGPTTAYLHRAASSGVTLVGVCAGALTLCRAGLMRERRTCVSWYHHQAFRDEFPGHEVVADRLFLVDSERVTCPGGAGTADLALHLIETRLGKARAQRALHMFHMDRMRRGDDAQHQPPFIVDVADNLVRRAILVMEQNIPSPLPITGIAAQVGLSTRQLERHFGAALKRTPGAVYREVRMRYASWLLTNTSRTMTEIAVSSGFSDCSHFLREFRKVHGAAPSERRNGDLQLASGILVGGRVFD
jgi:transcriptional regulator GlxA family with amidase domain